MDFKKDNVEKTDLEILQERAEVLGRAGEKLALALNKLKAIESVINVKMESLTSPGSEQSEQSEHSPADLIGDINGEIRHYNEAREYAKLRYYYLIVTREAMGFRRHKSVEEVYSIPPKKKPLTKRNNWTGTKTKESGW
jgi:uncharacterized membrane protein YgaE (UPF0421/DUF939 family)